MESRVELAGQKKDSGKYNCAQAVACCYCDLTGMDEETTRSICHAFGAGMGCMEGTCGAIVGAGLVSSMIRRDNASSMKDMRHIIARFLERNGTIRCKELKGVETKQMLRHCTLCVKDACEFLEEAILQE